MTLSYWWMHWFWITSRVCFAVSEDATITTHSIVPDPRGNASELVHHAKTVGPSNFSPPIGAASDTPSNDNKNSSINRTLSTSPPSSSGPPLAAKYPKPSPNKPHSNATKSNCTKSHFPRKTTVIHQNATTDVGLINVTDTTVAENFTFNETDYNQSLSSSERISEDENGDNLSAAGITGITVGCVVIVGAICVVSFVLFRNRGFNNRPQVLNDRCSNPDSSGYLDDTSVRDNSEEMYSLDNDSFLNSLEAMTIQNYWTDTVKHTKL